MIRCSGFQGPSGNLARLLTASMLTLAWSGWVMAEDRLLLEGILDGEVFRRDFDPAVLYGNESETFTAARLQLWSAAQISPSLQAFAFAEAETYGSSGERDTEVELQQYALRYSSNSEHYYYIEAGKFLSPFNAYLVYYLSTQNPLIGHPIGDYSTYPLGIQAAGSADWFDFRAAMVDLPPASPEYLMGAPDSAFRPELGFGVTPMTGLRIGVAYSKGPYLNRESGEYLPAGSDWKSFDQRLFDVDFQFSRGYAELNGAVIFSRYEVPFHNQKVDYTNAFVELKYTWTPRLFSAVRLQIIEYPFVSYLGDMAWQAGGGTVHDMEIGLGYRFGPDTLLKVDYRFDHWKAQSYQGYIYPDGHSLGLQLSHQFDVRSWFSNRP